MNEDLDPRTVARELGRIGTLLRSFAAGLNEADEVTAADRTKIDGWAHRMQVLVRLGSAE